MTLLQSPVGSGRGGLIGSERGGLVGAVWIGSGDVKADRGWLSLEVLAGSVGVLLWSDWEFTFLDGLAPFGTLGALPLELGGWRAWPSSCWPPRSSLCRERPRSYLCSGGRWPWSTSHIASIRAARCRGHGLNSSNPCGLLAAGSPDTLPCSTGILLSARFALWGMKNPALSALLWLRIHNTDLQKI